MPLAGDPRKSDLCYLSEIIFLASWFTNICSIKINFCFIYEIFNFFKILRKRILRLWILLMLQYLQLMMFSVSSFCWEEKLFYSSKRLLKSLGGCLVTNCWNNTCIWASCLLVRHQQHSNYWILTLTNLGFFDIKQSEGGAERRGGGWKGPLVINTEPVKSWLCNFSCVWHDDDYLLI